MATKSEWRVTANPIGGCTLYGVYRLLDTSEVDHSGNREIYGDYVDDRPAAEEIARKLNLKEKAAGQTGLEFLKTATAEEIAEVLATGHPPVGIVHCDNVYCRDCWLEWLLTGKAKSCNCDRRTGKEAPHE